MPITTLLVDDASDIRTLLRIALRSRGGFEVVGEAESGAAAIDLAALLRPDVIVLDLGLPDLAARDLLGRLRRVSPTSSIVIFSGSDTDRPWFEQRAAGYVVKDADIDHLVDVLLDVGTAQEHHEAALELSGDVIAAREARAVVRDVLGRWGYRELIDDATLVVSELVTNAVEHARSTCAVILNRSEGGVRIEVRDQGPGSPSLQPPSDTAEGGRGLMIVSALATAWGTQATPYAKSVWVELSAPGPT
jgi:anti-sigma regulatory factor (Ser/Thr protein kinase)/CheY-like chemotaxis protein